MENTFKRVKSACYLTNISMSILSNLPAILLLTFHSLYGISFTLLGLLVFVNYFTQLIVDMFFSLFSYKFNIEKAVRITPVLTVIGLLIYGVWPFIFPNSIYIGLIIGTIIFASSGGFVEVLISPVIAAIPSENPDREMSKLHSVYAWGVVGTIIFSTLFLLIFKNQNWQYLVFLLMIVPIIASCMFFKAKIPEMETPKKVSGILEHFKKKELWLCVFAIFLGGASECIMAQWSSSYLEEALSIPKVWGDIFGVALFAVMLGLGRTLYSKFGKNVEKVLFIGSIFAAICYIITALINIPILGLITCAFTGFCVSMLWPGTLIVSSKKVPTGGVFMFALMAAGGDLGASVGPQIVGIIVDVVGESSFGIDLAAKFGLNVNQLGMKMGMLFGSIFPIIAIFVFGYILKSKKKSEIV